MENKQDWVIANVNLKNLPIGPIVGTFFYHCKSTLTTFIKNGNKISFLIDGFILPRMRVYSLYSQLNQYELFEKLYLEHGNRFIEYIKGVFNIVVFVGEKFYLFNDRHAVKKFFVYKKKQTYVISNNLKRISENVTLKLDKENAAIFCLLSHFIDGMTLFRHTLFSGPASIVSLQNGTLSIGTYWTPKELFNAKKRTRKGSYVQHAKFWQSLIRNYVEYLRPKKIALTLTGGNDSRMVLAALLNLGVPYSLFTFGNPESADGIIARQICDKLSEKHYNYHVYNPDSKWLRSNICEIQKLSDSLINIHRAHRNYAASRHKTVDSESDMLLTGLMGGEYLKDPPYNNIVLPLLFKAIDECTTKNSQLDLLKIELKRVGIEPAKVDLEILSEKILKFLNKVKTFNCKEKKFFYCLYFYGSSHHSQDSQIFLSYFKYIVNPFMDIDFLEYIFFERLSYVFHNKFSFQKIFHSYFHVKITHLLAPQLSKIEYAKKGRYTASDLLFNPIAYSFKRARYFIKKEEYTQNFPMGYWLYSFCSEQIVNMNTELMALFEKSFLKNQLGIVKNKTTEESWHPLTNPINLNEICNYYLKQA